MQPAKKDNGSANLKKKKTPLLVLVSKRNKIVAVGEIGRTRPRENLVEVVVVVSGTVTTGPIRVTLRN